MDIVFPINGLVSGLLLLGLSFSNKITGVLRILAFILGLVSLVQLLTIVDSFLYRFVSGVTGRDEGFSVMGSLYDSITDKDLETNEGSGRGRVYLRPRVPMIKDGVRVSVQGNPGSKIVYWPVGGNGIGARNDALDLHGQNLQGIRTRALGVGVTVLDEEGKGIAITEDGVAELLFREVYGGEGSRGGPVNRVTLTR
jgi:hypothetical protein